MNPDEEYEYDGFPTFIDYDAGTEVLYDVDGEQHIEMLDKEECS